MWALTYVGVNPNIVPSTRSMNDAGGGAASAKAWGSRSVEEGEESIIPALGQAHTGPIGR